MRAHQVLDMTADVLHVIKMEAGETGESGREALENRIRAAVLCEAIAGHCAPKRTCKEVKPLSA